MQLVSDVGFKSLMKLVLNIEILKLRKYISVYDLTLSIIFEIKLDIISS